MSYDAVLFDNDGIIVEPTSWAEIRPAIRSAFERLGVDDPTEEAIEGLIDVSVPDVRAVADAHGVDAEALWRERDAAASAYQIASIHAGETPLYDDADAIRSMPAPRAIVSNNQHATVSAVVEHFDLGSWFDVVYGRQPTLADVRRKKPDPYYLERTLERLDATDALFVGDSPSDLVAARRAGIDAAFVRRPHRADVELPFEPRFEVPDLAALRARLE